MQIHNSNYYLKYALKLAKKSKGKTSLNPAVGCVIEKNGKIIGKGFHQYFGGPHAEIEAINSLTEPPENSSMYVTLEPCSHFGKTPPCVDEIIKYKFKKVIIGMQDVNPLVNGAGITKLKNAGIEVEINNLNNQINYFYRDFIKFIKTGQPFIRLKAAISIDGKIALKNGMSKWITNFSARKFVHKLRNEVDAILIGVNTLLIDNPELTVRHIKNSNENYKIILDTSLKTKLDCNIFKSNKFERIIIITASNNFDKINSFKDKGVNIIKTEIEKNGLLNLKSVLNDLTKFGIKDILVEGGSKIFTYFLVNNLVDEFYFFISNKIIGNDGLPVFGDLNLSEFEYFLSPINIKKFQDNILIHSCKFSYK
ncbi:MAG TPA: bifunctional diaminohydroxyphosphoribosylaminopyrimidine deaminase/5-amino-6-(5-phosphoribosylamino)uracil reductase RibD [bacterium]|nr:bifunctional diaminohydroxyphosphoribosylaminopyrimidine deaminase/5-amino-6-(5-phosphoribosylamino)uracil reductase RibD [bacterium]HOL46830.1 bifunctional diaminohydroxyphosphoribosylaminopyrimidine deaminase/5-amino-6-(5-phosphoribosylamino)uracil reductase RibD [bacterium]HPQ18644.1 bifunctional diaminohydroxyphosphoribosylaminopyrimidine deaminase/5-amino-6-(5-phosphoribosylamino)uracil reductase RibD [bacterium]